MQAELKQALHTELYTILDYWMKYTPDREHGGFFGKLHNNNHHDPFAVKGAVLNARILWTFSAAYNSTGEEQFLKMADRAYDYFARHFIDKEFGGVYWSVDYKGHPVETKKQVYAIAFAVYAYSEYYKARGQEEVKQMAIELYNRVQQHSYDPVYGGYLEAFTRNWQEIKDLRLSNKDANEKKTMNTHLHVLEAYANLYTIWPAPALKENIRDLLVIFRDKIIDPGTGHLHLFFDEQWRVKGDTVSYGHDIEASWLLLEAAEIIGDPLLIDNFKELSLKMAHATLVGIDKDGGLWYEYEPSQRNLVAEKHWWPQAEAVVGFINAWQLHPEGRYLQHAVNSWNFIRERIRDKVNGEWYWGVRKDNSIMEEDKVGLWKCPYHNVRACLEGMTRITRMSEGL
ncbi:AGE family epimerase/isomerase [Chitinophaga sp. MM2321]|uniref:AGE family epimerase/isomerase n=1 Tax=Chitinophaga sp. MM2321 TaxID=3137178 RepID=UPI0032D58F83